MFRHVSTSAKLDRYLKRGRKFVDGWLESGAARMITAVGQLQIGHGISGNIAEIGVYHGKLFILLYLLSRDTERAVAVDTFADENYTRGSLTRFITNLRRHADDERLVLHQGDSIAIDSERLVELAGGYCRLISVDGGHNAEITMHDLATAEGALRPGGVVMLDDFFNDMFPGVSEGAYHYFSKCRRIAPFAIGANKVLFCHRGYEHCYIETLRKLAKRTVIHQFLGASVLCLDLSVATLPERANQYVAWRAVRDIGPVKLARRVYRWVRAARSLNVAVVLSVVGCEC
jgi:hypothetical protein